MRRIREWRRRKFLTQTQLAEALGVSLPTVQRWETAGATPRLGHLKQLAEVLGVPEPEVLAEAERAQQEEAKKEQAA